VDPDGLPRWRLTRFGEHLDVWAKIESQDVDMRLVVIDWIMTRTDDPYAGVRREPGFENLWFGRIPRTMDDQGSMVTCSYFIFESTRIVRCNGIGRLNLPL
jgi:hypothetical protein